MNSDFEISKVDCTLTFYIFSTKNIGVFEILRLKF